ncbi:GNAT family N-acetyltransferase [Paenibacillus qinlingensis]|uniref:GNAT family N-acetyltransferase n=1 Tax=Paenibacillus qinlingensis TaxID=1837343 RepID=UPI001566F439|nr:GNAT family N-acetyltransferase [Paenibacillus qinlingensis]NQX57616.1 N-acetyltransferase family protein [Paenibacillus qinlingensis]
MGNSLHMRDAQLEDLAEIVRIYNSTIAGRMVTADTEPVSTASRERWFHEHSADFRPLWVLENENGICGWLSFQSFYGRPAYNATAEVSIYVDETYRGQGIGRYLMEQALETSPKLGIKSLLGFIFGHNEPSLQLFRKFGFTNWAHLPGVAELDGVERDLIILGKRVG